MHPKRNWEHILLWALLLLTFVFMFTFLVVSAKCKMNQPDPIHPINGWIIRGSAVPWNDPPPSPCFWL